MKKLRPIISFLLITVSLASVANIFSMESGSQEQQDTEYCAICITDVERQFMVRLQCDHYFCPECIRSYINTGANNSTHCPICRAHLCGSNCSVTIHCERQCAGRRIIGGDFNPNHCVTHACARDIGHILNTINRVERLRQQNVQHNNQLQCYVCDQQANLTLIPCGNNHYMCRTCLQPWLMTQNPRTAYCSECFDSTQCRNHLTCDQVYVLRDFCNLKRPSFFDVYANKYTIGLAAGVAAASGWFYLGWKKRPADMLDAIENAAFSAVGFVLEIKFDRDDQSVKLGLKQQFGNVDALLNRLGNNKKKLKNKFVEQVKQFDIALQEAYELIMQKYYLNGIPTGALKKEPKLRALQYNMEQLRKVVQECRKVVNKKGAGFFAFVRENPLKLLALGACTFAGVKLLKN